MQIAVDYGYRPAKRASSSHIAKLLAQHEDTYALFLEAAEQYIPFFEKIPVSGDPEGTKPFWVNGWLPGLDSVSIYTILAKFNPRSYVEVGSGNSTKFAHRAIIDQKLRTHIVSIDPEPRAAIDSLADTTIRKPLEDADLGLFRNLQSGDVVFIDSSHRSFQNSDVTVFFTEILPMLPGGVVYGLHDIFLPNDYPRA
jgi:hypothetical protein